MNIEKSGLQELKRCIASLAKEKGAKTSFEYLRDDGGAVYYSFKEVCQRCQKAQEQFEKVGLRPGDRAAIIAPSRPASIFASLSLAYGNITSVLIDASLPPEEINRLLHEADVRAVFTCNVVYHQLNRSIMGDVPVFNLDESKTDFVLFPDASQKVGKEKTVDPDLDVIAILYSSGTTNNMKGVLVTYRAIIDLLPMWHRLAGMTELTRFLLVLPFNHIAGYSCTFAFYLAGCEIGMLESLDASKLQQGLMRYNPTHFAMVPKVYEIMEQKARQAFSDRGVLVESLLLAAMAVSGFTRKTFGINIGRHLFKSVNKQIFGTNIYALASGATPCKASTSKFFLDLGLEWANTYATTESGVPITATGVFDKYPVGTEGRIDRFNGVEVKIYNPDENGVGEVRVRSILSMKGYFRNPEASKSAFDEDGYFRTGDLGYVDARKYLHITGRIKETILLRTGKKVAPTDVESFYCDSIPGVSIAACGVQKADTAFDRIHLFVASEGLDQAEQESILRRLEETRALVSSMYIFEDVHFIPELPMTSVGKVKRFQLRQIAMEKSLTAAGIEGVVPIGAIEGDQEVSKTIEQYIISAVCAACPRTISEEDVSRFSLLREDLGIDSLGMMELCAGIESRYGKTLENELASIRSISDMIDAVGRDHAIKNSSKYNIQEYPKQKTAMQVKNLKKLMGLSRLIWDITTTGIEKVPETGSFILCPNHQSHLDSLWVLTALGTERANLEKFCCLAKEEHLEHGYSRYALALLGGIPVDRSGNPAPAMKKCLSCIRDEGYTALIHPEGTRTLDGSIHEFKPGAAALAIKADVPLVPVRIEGAYTIYPSGALLPRLGRTKEGGKHPLEIHFGDPLYPDMKTAAELTRELQAAVEHLR